MRAVPLRSRSCIIDGEAVAWGRVASRCSSASGIGRAMPAYSSLRLSSDDLRREPLERRKATLARLLARAGHGVQLNEHLEAEGPVVFEHACRLGLEGSSASASPRGISQAARGTG